MILTTKQEILEALTLPEPEFQEQFAKPARETLAIAKGNTLSVRAMLGYSNICKNQCLYCGMRAGMKLPNRYRLSPQEVAESAKEAANLGLRRIFLISGEDPGYSFDDLLLMVRLIRATGLSVSMAAGEFSQEGYQALRDAGVDEYVMKFEMGDPAVFDRLNPSTTFRRRMDAIDTIQRCGLRLASGNIVDYPGQTPEQLAQELLLMRQLEISWAPVIPYMPVVDTPLAAEGGPGDRKKCLREIALLRLMMPQCDITAQQPGDNPEEGLGSQQGNLDALCYGANLLFLDLLPTALSRDFSVVNQRLLGDLEQIRDTGKQAGLTVAPGI